MGSVSKLSQKYKHIEIYKMYTKIERTEVSDWLLRIYIVILFNGMPGNHYNSTVLV